MSRVETNGYIFILGHALHFFFLLVLSLYFACVSCIFYILFLVCFVSFGEKKLGAIVTLAQVVFASILNWL